MTQTLETRAAPGLDEVEAPTRAARRSAAARDRCTSLLFLAVAVTGAVWVRATNPFDTDGWWHLADGELMLRRGSLPKTDPFSWTANGRPWRLAAWLYDLVAAVLERAGGRVAVSALALAAAAALGFACYGLARRAGAATWPAAQLAALSVFLLSPFVAERAQMLSYLLFAATLALAPRALRGSNRSLAVLCGLVALWSNLHLAFVVGVGTVGLIALATALQERALPRAIFVVTTVGLAGLANPYGIRAYQAALKVRAASSTITEWRHASLRQPYDVIVLLLVVGAGIALWRTGRWRRPDVVLPLTALTVLTADAIRNGPYLVLLVAIELAVGLSQGVGANAAGRTRSRTVHVVAMTATMVLLAAAVGFHGVRGAPDRIYPVRSAAAVPNGCRLLNEYGQGGYLIDHRWPDVLVSQDGRNDLYGDDELERQAKVLDGQPGWRNWIDEHHVDCVIAYPVRPLIHKLESAGWTRAASDPSAVLLVRPGGSAQ